MKYEVPSCMSLNLLLDTRPHLAIDGLGHVSL